MPDLEKMVDLCRNLDSWLRADPQNIIVVHCHVSGGRGRREEGGQKDRQMEGWTEGEVDGGREEER